MWLLDVNLPTALTRLLRTYNIDAQTTAARGWRELTNGALAQAASSAGFRVLMTRDRRFGASVGNILATLPGLAIVVVTLPQVREAAYLSAFDAAWQHRPIAPVAGEITEWP
jgi:predicted nuclease of predicted toxin-antitoxin system